MKKILLLFILFSLADVNAQTIVSSLSELKPYMDDDNVNVKLAPGIYFLTAADITSGDWGEALLGGRKVMSFSGNNSIYDFTDVTINFNTDLPSGFASDKGNGLLTELHVMGNDNVLKNLTMVNNGDPEVAPLNSATNIVMDGQRNRIEGFHLTVRGSYPYGYGDTFGKEGGSVINHKKRSAILIRGDYNHLLETTVITHAYGHGIFMQGAVYPTIEGCYVEGQLRTTDDMLAEEGTGSPADNVDFMTDWGYRLPPGYTMSLSEDGIRGYSSGITIIDGEVFSRGATSNATVVDCTVKGMRGVGFPFGSGHSISNSTVIDNEGGINMGQGGTIDNCVSNFFAIPSNRSGVTVDITLVPYARDHMNSNRDAALITGSNHDITIRASKELVDLDFPIRFGADNLQGGIRTLNNFTTFAASNSVINNDSALLLDISSTSQDNSGTSCGAIFDQGANNTISRPNECSDLDRPYAFPQSVSTVENSSVAISLSGFAASPSYAGALNFSVTQYPTNGTISGTIPNLTFTPSEDFNGHDSFSFTVTDNVSTSEEAIVNIEVIKGALVIFEHTAGATTPDIVNSNITATSGLGGSLSGTVATSINQLSVALANGLPLQIPTDDFNYFFSYQISSKGTPITYENMAIDAYTKHVDRRHQISYIIEGEQEVFITDGSVVSGNINDEGNLEYYDFPDFTTTDNVEFRVYWQGNTNNSSNGRTYVDYFSLNSFSPLMAHAECGLGGDVFALEEGQYSTFLGAFTGDAISRIQIAQGFEVEVFKNDDFTGDSNVYSAIDTNTCLDGDAFNDSIKSLIIRNVLLGTDSERLKEEDSFVYPNPVLSNLHVSLDKRLYEKYSLFSMQGRLIKEVEINKGEQELDVDVSNLKPGMYILSIKGVNADKFFKVIKE